MHGTCLVKGDDWWGVNKEIKLKTNATANYSDGKLNGSFTMSQTGTIRGSSNSWSFKASFNNGVPNGIWTYTETDITKKNATMTASITWSNGKVTAFKSENGYSITINEDGYINSGTINGETYKNGMLTDHFFRKNGDWSQVEPEQKSLIDLCASGKITENELLDKGYILEEYYSEVSKWFFSHLYYDYVNINWYDKDFVYPNYPKFKVLKKVPAVVSYDEILDWYTNKYINNEADWYYYHIDLAAVEKERNIYGLYMTPETIQKFKSFLEEKSEEVKAKKQAEAKAAEERRLAEQKEAEERRMAEQKAAEEKIQSEEREQKAAVIKQAMDKLVALSASKFDVKVFGGDIQIHVDYDNNPSFWRQLFTSESDLKTRLGEKLKPFFAVDGYVINEIDGNICTCTIEKFVSKKKVEYWKTTITLTDELKIDLDESFDFSKAEKIGEK